MCKFTIILPIYNVAPYIRRCLDTITEQLFGDFEVLCVDDCSTDNTVYIVEEFLKNDARFKLIKHDKNSGPGIARNTGFDHAKGEYIICIDPDDMIDVRLLETLYNKFQETDADCIWFNAGVYDLRTKEKTVIFNNDSYFNHDGFYDITPDNIYKGADYIWNKAFKASVIKKFNLRFPPTYFGEDSEFYYKAFTQIKRVYYINQYLYLYRKRDQSLVDKAKQGSVNFKDTFDVFMNIFKYLDENNLVQEYKEAICHMLIIRIGNRIILGQNENILRMASEVLSKINFPECFSVEK